MKLAHHLYSMIIVPLVLLTACAGLDYQHLPTVEQELYRAYSQIMSSGQRRAFLALSTTAEREAFAKEIGIAQRFNALTPEEQQAARHGQAFKGMSDEALRFVWGDPCRERGPAAHQTWIYEGPVFSLPSPGWNCSSHVDTYTEVQLVNGKVQWWIERVPTGKGRRGGRRGG
jgi:hypothetical protein